MKTKKIEIHALIPARSGSKGIKNKNIIKIKNKELIGYTIEFAKKIKIFDKVVVSTDSKLIGNISKKFGAEVPFLRPKKYSKDSSTDLEVFKHYVSWLKKNNKKIPEVIVHLRATTPFRRKKKILDAIKTFLKEKKASSLRSVKSSNFTPFKMWMFKNKKIIKPVISYNKKLETHSISRQNLSPTFQHIGFVDIIRTKKTIYRNSTCGNTVIPYIFKKKDLKNYVDIDTHDDLLNAKNISLKLK